MRSPSLVELSYLGPIRMVANEEQKEGVRVDERARGAWCSESCIVPPAGVMLGGERGLQAIRESLDTGITGLPWVMPPFFFLAHPRSPDLDSRARREAP
jgi:hypothetical protein